MSTIYHFYLFIYLFSGEQRVSQVFIVTVIIIIIINVIIIYTALTLHIGQTCWTHSLGMERLIAGFDICNRLPAISLLSQSFNALQSCNV